MRRLIALVPLALACIYSCGDAFAVPTDPNTHTATSSGTGSCQPGYDPNCPAITGTVAGLSFDFTPQAAMAVCGDSSTNSSFTRYVVTNGPDACITPLAQGINQRDLVLDLTGGPNNPVLQRLGVLATDANGALVLPAAAADPNSQDPNFASSPTTLDPNSPRALEPLTLLLIDFPGAISSDVVFDARPGSGPTMHASFRASVCASRSVLCNQ